MFNPQHLKHLPQINSKLFEVCYKAIRVKPSHQLLGHTHHEGIASPSNEQQRSYSNASRQEKVSQQDPYQVLNHQGSFYLVIPQSLPKSDSQHLSPVTQLNPMKTRPSLCPIIPYNPPNINSNYQQNQKTSYSYIFLEGQFSLQEYCTILQTKSNLSLTENGRSYSQSSWNNSAESQNEPLFTEQQVWPLILTIADALAFLWRFYKVQHPHLMGYAIRVIDAAPKFYSSNSKDSQGLKSYGGGRDIRQASWSQEYINCDYKCHDNPSYKRFKLIYHRQMVSTVDMLIKNRADNWQKYYLAPQQLIQLENKLKLLSSNKKQVQKVEEHQKVLHRVSANRCIFSLGLLIMYLLLPSLYRKNFPNRIYCSDKYAINYKNIREMLALLKKLYSKNLLRVMEGCLEEDPQKRLENGQQLMKLVKRQINKIGKKRQKLLKKIVDNGLIKGVGFQIFWGQEQYVQQEQRTTNVKIGRQSLSKSYHPRTSQGLQQQRRTPQKIKQENIVTNNSLHQQKFSTNQTLADSKFSIPKCHNLISTSQVDQVQSRQSQSQPNLELPNKPSLGLDKQKPVQIAKPTSNFKTPSNNEVFESLLLQQYQPHQNQNLGSFSSPIQGVGMVERKNQLMVNQSQKPSPFQSPKYRGHNYKSEEKEKRIESQEQNRMNYSFAAETTYNQEKQMQHKSFFLTHSPIKDNDSQSNSNQSRGLNHHFSNNYAEHRTPAIDQQRGMKGLSKSSGRQISGLYPYMELPSAKTYKNQNFEGQNRITFNPHYQSHNSHHFQKQQTSQRDRTSRNQESHLRKDHLNRNLSKNQVMQCQVIGKQTFSMASLGKNSSLLSVHKEPEEFVQSSNYHHVKDKGQGNIEATLGSRLKRQTPRNNIEQQRLCDNQNISIDKLERILKERSILRRTSSPKNRKGLSLSSSNRKDYAQVKSSKSERDLKFANQIGIKVEESAQKSLSINKLNGEANQREFGVFERSQNNNTGYQHEKQVHAQRPSVQGQIHPCLYEPVGLRQNTYLYGKQSQSYSHIPVDRPAIQKTHFQKFRVLSKQFVNSQHPKSEQFLKFPTYRPVQLSCPEHMPFTKFPECDPNRYLQILKLELFLCAASPIVVSLQKVIKELTSVENGVWIDGDLYFGEMRNGRRNGLGLQLFAKNAQQQVYSQGNGHSAYSPKARTDSLHDYTHQDYNKQKFRPKQFQEFYFGYFVEDLFHSQGFYHWNYKEYFIGKFDAGQKTKGFLHGQRLQYLGQFTNGKRHGQGLCWYNDGTFYYGQYNKGRKHGHCRLMIEPTGDLYIGEFKKNRRQGYGVYFSPNSTLKGSWDGDQTLIGNVQIFENNGGYYKGQLEPKTFRKHGRGQYSFHDGAGHFTGIFERDEFVNGTVKYKNGGVYKGSLKNGKETGTDSTITQMEQSIREFGLTIKKWDNQNQQTTQEHKDRHQQSDNTYLLFIRVD